MDIVSSSYMPGDQRLIDQIVYELKSQGIFDQFRRECIADVDTKPAYQNLSQRLEGSVMNFLNKQKFSEDVNKNQLREQLRKSINESGFLDSGVERIVDQVVNPKISSVFLPKVVNVVYRYLGIQKPNETEIKDLSDEVKVKDKEIIDTLLPKDLEAVSPESSFDHSFNSTDKKLADVNDFNKDETLEEDESPPFEPLDEDLKLFDSADITKLTTTNNEIIESDNQDTCSQETTQASVNNEESKAPESSANDLVDRFKEESEDSKMDISDSDDLSRDTVPKERIETPTEVSLKVPTEVDPVKKSDDKKPHDKHKSAKREDKDKRSHSKSESKSKDHKDRSSSKQSSKDKDKKDEKAEGDIKDKTSSKSKDNKEKPDKKIDKYKSEKEKSYKDKDKHKSSKDKDKSKSDRDKSSSKHSRDKSSSKKDDSSKSSKDKSTSKSKDSSKDTKDRESKSKEKERSKSSSKDKDRKDSSRHSDKRKNDKDKSSSTKKYKKPEDDHYSHKDKKRERRSTDRDSNDGSSKPKKSEQPERINSSKNGSKEMEDGFSGGGDSTSNSDNVEQVIRENVVVPETAVSSDDIKTEVPQLTSPIKYVKPKFASNIHEAMRIMKIRKQLAKLEKQNQLALANLPIEANADVQLKKDKSKKRKQSPKSKQEEEPKEDNIVRELHVQLERLIAHTEEVEEDYPVKNQSLSLETFAQLEARLAQEMAKINQDVYEDDDDYEYDAVNFSPKKKCPEDDSHVSNIVEETPEDFKGFAETSLTTLPRLTVIIDRLSQHLSKFDQVVKIKSCRPDHYGPGSPMKADTAPSSDSLQKINFGTKLPENEINIEPCRYLEAAGKLHERHLAILNKSISDLEKDIETVSLNIQNNIPSSQKKGRKRKGSNSLGAVAGDVADKRGRIHDINSVEHNDISAHRLRSTGSPEIDTTADKAAAKKKEKTVRESNKRYSSADLYKPRLSSRRRTGRLNN